MLPAIEPQEQWGNPLHHITYRVRIDTLDMQSV